MIKYKVLNMGIIDVQKINNTLVLSSPKFEGK